MYAKLYNNLSKPINSNKTTRLSVRGKAAHVIGNNNRSNQQLTRENHLKALDENVFDVLVIGGGATGAGCALDAVTRGLRTALVETDDFACGTSSKSTKLIHGGVRYLQDAVTKCDIKKLRMVREALQERATLLHIAPHLTNELPILLPVYSWLSLPYFWFGLKLYDLVASSFNLRPSHFMSAKKIVKQFPLLRRKHLVGGIVYYDGQHDDARMCVSTVLTAALKGATVCNYVHAQEISDMKPNGLRSVLLTDQLTRQSHCVNTKCVINAAGPFIDCVRRMDVPNAKPLVRPSSGTHIVLPGHFSSSMYGLLDPSTKDGRILFMLPWHGHTLVGTTDKQADLTQHPQPQNEDINFLLSSMRKYLREDVLLCRKDVLSAWTGLRPLVISPDGKVGHTKELVRNHLVVVSENNLITIAGGKWTTFREMAEHTIDAAIDVAGLQPRRGCCTRKLLIDGAHHWNNELPSNLSKCFEIPMDIAEHLSKAYGTNAFKLLSLYADGHKRLHNDFPYIEAEVEYAVFFEYALTAVDVVARRMRVAFLDVGATLKMLPRIISIMAERFCWSKETQEAEVNRTIRFLTKQMGMGRVTLTDTSMIESQLKIEQN